MSTFTFLVCSLLQACTTNLVLLLDLISQLQSYSSSSPYLAVQAVLLVCNPPSTSFLSLCYPSGPVSLCKQFHCPKIHPPFPLLISPNHIPHSISQDLCANFTMLQDQFFFPVYSSQTASPSSPHRYNWGALSMWNHHFFSMRFQIQARHSSKWSCKMSLQVRQSGKRAAKTARVQGWLWWCLSP